MTWGTSRYIKKVKRKDEERTETERTETERTERKEYKGKKGKKESVEGSVREEWPERRDVTKSVIMLGYCPNLFFRAWRVPIHTEYILIHFSSFLKLYDQLRLLDKEQTKTIYYCFWIFKLYIEREKNIFFKW